MYCPQCGTKNLDQNEFCTSCGAKLSTDNKSTTSPHANIKSGRSPDSLLKQFETDDPSVVSSGFNIGMLIASFLIPLIGIVMGIIYMRKDHPAQKKAGKNWLIVAAIGTLINLFLMRR